MTDPVERADVRLAGVAGGVLVVAVIAAVVRAIAGDWYPVGDNAYFALRASDVLGDHHPLLGTWTSASHSLGFDVNNPGPLLFDVLAPPAWVDPTLLPIGVGALVLASIAAVVGCSARVAGVRGAVVGLFASAALAWTIGPVLLVDPWQPHALLFPFLVALVATVAVWSGSNGSLVVLAVSSSLLVQTHLTFGPTVALLCGSACIAVGVRWIRSGDDRPAILRAVALTALVAVVSWSQPVYEQFTADERGNLSRLAEAAAAERTESIGVKLGIEIAGTLLQPVPAWVPPSFDDDFQQDVDEALTPPAFQTGPSATVAGSALAGTIVLLAALAVWARRSGWGPVVSAAGVTCIAVVATTFTVITLPLQSYGLAPHHVRFLWPVSVLITATLTTVVVGRRLGLRAVAVLAVVLALLALVPRDATVGPEVDDYAGPVMRELAPQLESLQGTGALVYDPDSARVYEPYSTPVVLELDQRGVEVVVEEPGLVRQLGPSREADGSEAGRFYVWEGDLAAEGRPGLERVAFVDGLTEAERDELRALTEVFAERFRSGEVQLTERGRRAVTNGRLPDVQQLLEETEEPLAAIGVGTILLGLERGQLTVTGDAGDAERLALLHARATRGTVGVWVEWSTVSDG